MCEHHGMGEEESRRVEHALFNLVCMLTVDIMSQEPELSLTRHTERARHRTRVTLRTLYEKRTFPFSHIERCMATISAQNPLLQTARHVVLLLPKMLQA